MSCDIRGGRAAADDLSLAGTVEQSFNVKQTIHDTIAAPAARGPSKPVVELSARNNTVRILSPFLPLLLYLCSEAPDLADGTRMPQKPQGRISKGQERLFPPPAPIGGSMGMRRGAALRQAREREAAAAAADEAEGRRTVRPHLRRAHWAHRWTGPRTGERRTILRWIHPALVNAASPGELPSVIRPVQAGPAGDGFPG